MTISVLDTASAMTSILDVDEAQRPDLVRQMREPMSSMHRFTPSGSDLMQVHEQSFAFPVDRDARLRDNPALIGQPHPQSQPAGASTAAAPTSNDHAQRLARQRASRCGTAKGLTAEPRHRRAYT